MKLLTKEELQHILNCNKVTVNHLVTTRKIPFIMIGKEARFRQSSIEQWLTDREKKATFESTEGV